MPFAQQREEDFWIFEPERWLERQVCRSHICKETVSGALWQHISQPHEVRPQSRAATARSCNMSEPSPC